MKVLILGVGQVGTFVAAALEADGHDVVGADIEPDIAFFRRYGPSDAVELIDLNVMDPMELKSKLAYVAPEALVLTFGINGISFEQTPQRGFAINVEGPVNVAQAARNAGIVSRIIFLSSFAAYGRQPVDRLAESTTPAPSTHYGAAKLAAEKGLKDVCSDIVDLRILRPCGLYGPIRYDRGSHSARLLESLLLAAAHAKQISLQWSATDADEYIYVKDLARAIACAVGVKREEDHRPYNVGTGIKTSAAELVDSVRCLWPDFSPELVEVPSRHKYAMPVLDISRARKELGFTPEYELTRGLRDLALTTGLLR